MNENLGATIGRALGFKSLTMPRYFFTLRKTSTSSCSLTLPHQWEAAWFSLMRQLHNCHRRLQGPSWTRFPVMAPRGALGREAKHSARIELRSFSPGFGARSLTVSELAGLRPSPKRIEIFPHPWAPYPWGFSFSLSQWAPAEEAELIGEEQEVWDREIVAAT